LRYERAHASLYATSRMGAEWMVDYFSRRNDTPAVNQRIFYGYNTEFGVPTDIARQIRFEADHVSSTPPLTWGVLRFLWATQPPSVTNSDSVAPER